MGGHAVQVGGEVTSREDDIRAFGEWLDRRLENARFFETTTAVEDLPEDHPLRRRSEDARASSARWHVARMVTCSGSWITPEPSGQLHGPCLCFGTQGFSCA